MRQVARHIFSLGASRVISGLVLFLVYIRLVRYLGPDEFGKFALVLAYYMVFWLFIDFGIAKFVVKQISADRSRTGELSGNYFLIQAVLGAVFLVLMLVVPKVLHYESDVSAAMFLAGLGMLILSWSVPFYSAMQAWQRIHTIAIVNFINTLINAAWLLFSIALHKNFVFMFWLYVVIGLADLLVYFVLARRLAKIKFRLDPALAKTMFIFGLPFVLIGGFEMLITKADTIVQRFYLPYSQIGLYSAAYRFIDILTFVPAIIFISMFPQLAYEGENLSLETRNYLSRLNRYLMFAAAAVGIVGTFGAGRIVTALYSREYAGSILPLRILIWATVITFLYAIPNVTMQVRKNWQAVWVLALGTLFNILGNILLIPRYGIVASAWLTVATYLLVGVFYTLLARRGVAA